MIISGWEEVYVEHLTPVLEIDMACVYIYASSVDHNTNGQLALSSCITSQRPLSLAFGLVQCSTVI